MTNEENIPVSRDIIINRLKRVEGQVRGLQRMVSDERDCESIITQLAAVRSAIDSAGGLILNNYMTLCFNKNQDQEAETPLAEGESLKSLARVIAIWGRVKMGEGK